MTKLGPHSPSLPAQRRRAPLGQRKSEPAKTAKTLASEDQILAAAAQLFREQGFAATTLRDLAAKTGLLLGSVHYRFPSKDHILLALARQAVQRGTEKIERAISQGSDALDRARLGMRAYLELLLSEEDAVYVLLHEWRSVTAEVRRELALCQRELDNLCDRIFADVDKAGLLKPGVSPELLRLFGLGAANWTAQWYRPGQGASPAQIADALLAVLGAGVLNEKGHRLLATAGLPLAMGTAGMAEGDGTTLRHVGVQPPNAKSAKISMKSTV